MNLALNRLARGFRFVVGLAAVATLLGAAGGCANKPSAAAARRDRAAPAAAFRLYELSPMPASATTGPARPQVLADRPFSLPKDAADQPRLAGVAVARFNARPLDQLRVGEQVILPLPDAAPLVARVTTAAETTGGGTKIGGSLVPAARGGAGADVPAAARQRGGFVLIKGNRGVNGLIELPDRNAAYTLQTLSDGTVAVRARPISAVRCAGLPRPDPARLRRDPAPALADVALVANQPAFSSRPQAPVVLFLNFEGETVSGTTWNTMYTNGDPIVAARYDTDSRSGFNAAEVAAIRSAWQLVAEDFASFNVDVTTDRARYNATPAGRRMRCIVTPTDYWYPGAGGLAYVGSYGWGDDTPCWCWALGSSKGIGEASAHELGHTLGLDHDGRVNPAEEYYAGHGDGPTGWAPIMGVGYYRQLVQWSRGEYNQASNVQDDLMVMATFSGVTAVADDHPNTADPGATPLAASGNAIDARGVIASATDADVFQFTVQSAGQVDLTVAPAAADPNFHASVELLDAGGNVVVADKRADVLTARVTRALTPGQYYLRVRGTGTRDAAADGYSPYGSGGPYRITGTIP